MQNKLNNQIKYVIKLKDSILQNKGVFETYLRNMVNEDLVLYGLAIENITNSRFYFLSPEQAMIIIPHKWIDWMMPDRVNKEIIKNEE